jgi:hypothetical protein
VDGNSEGLKSSHIQNVLLPVQPIPLLPTITRGKLKLENETHSIHGGNKRESNELERKANSSPHNDRRKSKFTLEGYFSLQDIDGASIILEDYHNIRRLRKIAFKK